MKILLINNFYYNRGGDCTYLFSLKKLLEKKGHKVIIFSMNHPRNYESEYSKYFVSYINYDEEIKDINIFSTVKVFNRTIYSIEAKDKIETLIKNERPDIAHVQNIHHHITPSIFPVLRKFSIPIIWTLHDYTLICPNTSFLSHGKICEKCKRRKYFRTAFEKCKKDSFSASTMAGVETTVHRIMRFHDMVDYYIAPSKFLLKKFIEYGISADKLKRIDHFTDFSCNCEETSSNDYYLYVGRITQEKGIKTLIEAAILANADKLKIVGEGPILNEMIEYTKTRDENNIVEFLGHKNRAELTELYKNCKFIVVPSEWHEISGLIIFEAFTCGKPAIGSKMGGITELIKDMERGLIVDPGDVGELSAAIKYLLENPDIVEEMGENARHFVSEALSAEKHYQKLIKLYEKAISKHLVSTS